MDEDFDRLSREELIFRLLDAERQNAELQQENRRMQKKSEFLLASFFKAPTACVVLSPEGCIEVINDKVIEIFGYEREKVLSTNFLEKLPPERVRVFRDFVCSLTPSQNTFYFYFHHTMPDKVMRSYLWCNNGVFTPDGKLDYIIAYCLPGEMQEAIASHIWTLQQKDKHAGDMSQRLIHSLLEMMQENNTLDNRDILRLVCEHYDAEDSCLFRYEAETNVFRLQEIFQTEQSQVKNVDPGMAATAMPDYLDNYRNGECRIAYCGEVQLPNSLTVFLESRCIPYESTITVPVMANERFWGVLISVRERNAQRWLDSEIWLSHLFSRVLGLNLERIAIQKELERQQILMRLALEKSEVYPWQYNIEKDMYCNNELILKRYGFPIGEQPVFNAQMFFSLIHPDDLPVVIPLFAQVLQGGEGDAQIRVQIRKPEGPVYEWFEYRCIAVSDKETGKVTDVIGTGACIEKYKQAEQRLINLLKAKNQAEESNRLKSAFLANMSHEIRTPLNAILGFSEILITADDPEEKEEYVKIIRSNSDLLLKLINDILDISRIESGKTDFHYTDEDINELFDELGQSARISTQDKPVSITVKKGLPSCRMIIDRARVTQILMNFVSNAVKFTAQGSITLGYRLSKERRSIYFYVRDTGCGIAPDDCKQVFHRFVKLNDFAQGTGLGLSICETLVKKMNGYIGVKSALGKGSEFWFTLPLKREKDILPFS